MTTPARSHLFGIAIASALTVAALLLVIHPPERLAPAVDIVTTIDVTAQASTPPFGHATQVALTSATEAQVTLNNRVPTDWVQVQIFSPSAWTWRGTTGSTTDAYPVLANQIVSYYVTGLNLTFYPVGSATQTLYVLPITAVKPTF